MKSTVITAATAGASPELTSKIARTFPQSTVLASLDHFTEVGVEGIAIVAPGALHAEQAVDALERGRELFFQKPPRRAAIQTRPFAHTALAGAFARSSFRNGGANLPVCLDRNSRNGGANLPVCPDQGIATISETAFGNPSNLPKEITPLPYEPS